MPFFNFSLQFLPGYFCIFVFLYALLKIKFNWIIITVSSIILDVVNFMMRSSPFGNNVPTVVIVNIIVVFLAIQFILQRETVKTFLFVLLAVLLDYILSYASISIFTLVSRLQTKMHPAMILGLTRYFEAIVLLIVALAVNYLNHKNSKLKNARIPYPRYSI